jgi:ferredoxin
MKTFRIDTVGRSVDIATATSLAAALLAQGNGRIKQVCGGKGMCATCHVRVLAGAESLTPLNKREKGTLAMITGATPSSRLACQAKVVGEGVVIDVPPGIYLESIAQAEALIGRRAEEPLVHPVSGAILVPAGKIITRSTVMTLKSIDADVVAMLRHTGSVSGA